MSAHRNRPLSPAELDAFGAELDALRARVAADLGERDARYIRRIVAGVRYSEVIGRGLLWAGAIALLFTPWAWVALVIGTMTLGCSKILENMELGHNVMHGQYDWMHDPSLQGKTYEWDIIGTSDAWRRTHNHKHHTYTNVRGLDDDIGYGILRIFPEQKWRPWRLLQPLYAALLGLYFQWGVAIQELELGAAVKGHKTWRELWAEFKPMGRKAVRQLVKDYLVFPLLAGPGFLAVLLGNLVANGMRNLWTFAIIFCGHFTAAVEIFPRDSVKNESRGHWYLRQLRGSSNLSGSRGLHVMSGNLSHQIEHHLFPDLPACRYAEMAPEVQAICARYGQHYNTGSFARQFAQVWGRIFRHAFPSRVEARAPLLAA